MPEITVFIAFSAGLLSFFSPCLLPILPGFLAYVTGVPDQQTAKTQQRVVSVAHAFLFIVGFSLLYIALGWSASAVGALFFKYDVLLRRIGAIFIGAMGLKMLGLLDFAFLNRTVRVLPRRRALGPLASFFIGLTFALGWSPCIGPIMASILFLAGTHSHNGMVLMGMYSLGFAVPFIVTAYAFPSWRAFTRYTPAIQRIGGMLLVITAFLLWMDVLRGLASYLAMATNYVGV